MNIFEYNSYKTFIRDVIEDNQTERAFQKRLAIAAGCQPSYLSQALNSKVHITPDQAHGMSELLKLTEAETEFFLALVSLERSVKPTFAKFIQKRIELMRKAHFRLTEQIRVASNPEALSHFANIYYSAWYFIAIHILCTLPGIKDDAQIAERLALKREVVSKALSDLKENGLIEFKGGFWKATSQNIHLADNHAMISRHHFNWRFRATNQTHPVNEDEVQYTGVYSLSKKDLKKIKGILNETIVSVRDLARKSSEEDLINVNIDLLRV